MPRSDHGFHPHAAKSANARAYFADVSDEGQVQAAFAAIDRDYSHPCVIAWVPFAAFREAGAANQAARERKEG